MTEGGSSSPSIPEAASAPSREGKSSPGSSGEGGSGNVGSLENAVNALREQTQNQAAKDIGGFGTPAEAKQDGPNNQETGTNNMVSAGTEGQQIQNTGLDNQQNLDEDLNNRGGNQSAPESQQAVTVQSASTENSPPVGTSEGTPEDTAVSSGGGEAGSSQTAGQPESPEASQQTPQAEIKRENTTVGETAAEQQGPEAQAYGPKPEEAGGHENQQSAENSPKVPGKVANDPEFKKIWGDKYAEAKQKGSVDMSAIDKQAMDDYYGEQASAQIERGLPDEVKDDPLFNQKLGEEVREAASKGEPLDTNKLTEKALAKFQHGKDLEAENSDSDKDTGEEKQSSNKENDQIIKELMDRLGSLENKNSELMKLVEALGQYVKEDNPKKKDAWWIRAAKYAAILGLEGITNTGRQFTPQQ